MEIKIFGKSLFEFRGKGNELVYQTGVRAMKESKYLPDFYPFQGGNNSPFENSISNYIITEAPNGPAGSAVAIPIKEKKPKKSDVRVELTPKGVYECEMLHDKSFELKTDEKYVDEQLKEFQDKLALLNVSSYDMGRGIQEVSSIVMRLENRKKYADHREFFEQYPYTTTTKISEVVKVNEHLRLGQVEQFVADMPKEATAAMKEYTAACEDLCKKKPVFYIIANKKDFERTSKRRDPILLAQSPFGHFWQILGAWDEEMLLLENL